MAFHFAKAPKKNNNINTHPKAYCFWSLCPKGNVSWQRNNLALLHPGFCNPFAPRLYFCNPLICEHAHSNRTMPPANEDACNAQRRVSFFAGCSCSAFTATVAVSCCVLPLYSFAPLDVLHTASPRHAPGMTWEGFGFVPRFALITSKPTRHLRG